MKRCQWVRAADNAVLDPLHRFAPDRSIVRSGGGLGAWRMQIDLMAGQGLTPEQVRAALRWGSPASGARSDESHPRCKLCAAHFDGLGGFIFGHAGYGKFPDDPCPYTRCIVFPLRTRRWIRFVVQEQNQIQGQAKIAFLRHWRVSSLAGSHPSECGKGVSRRAPPLPAHCGIAAPARPSGRATGMSAPARGRMGFVPLPPCVKSASSRRSEDRENGAISVCEAIFAEEAFVAFAGTCVGDLYPRPRKQSGQNTPIRIECLSQTAFDPL
jgi:hypothetical protein